MKLTAYKAVEGPLDFLGTHLNDKQQSGNQGLIQL